jgi:hypothetical protein
MYSMQCIFCDPTLKLIQNHVRMEIGPYQSLRGQIWVCHAFKSLAEGCRIGVWCQVALTRSVRQSSSFNRVAPAREAWSRCHLWVMYTGSLTSSKYDSIQQAAGMLPIFIPWPHPEFCSISQVTLPKLSVANLWLPTQRIVEHPGIIPVPRKWTSICCTFHC